MDVGIFYLVGGEWFNRYSFPYIVLYADPVWSVGSGWSLGRFVGMLGWSVSLYIIIKLKINVGDMADIHVADITLKWFSKTSSKSSNHNA